MLKVKINKLSVFFPAYNEEDNIENTVKKAINILNNVAEIWEILIINDGSKDKTLEIADGLAKEDKRIKVINHKINRGYGAAFKSGLYNSKYPWIAFTDADGQFDFSEIVDFVEKQKESNADLVIGFYKKRQVSKLTILTSKMWEVAVYLMFGLKVKDVDCGFKLLSKKVVDSLPKLQSERGAFISSEFLIKAKKMGYKIVEIPVTHFPRGSGSATGRNFNVVFESFRDLFKLWREYK
jgi:glycosyltransferase involved in cell wall biosynthesis